MATGAVMMTFFIIFHIHNLIFRKAILNLTFFVDVEILILFNYQNDVIIVTTLHMLHCTTNLF